MRRSLRLMAAAVMATLILSTMVVIPAAAAAADHLAVAGYPSPTVAGVSHPFTVTAQDGTNATDTTYVGTVHFTSNDVPTIGLGDYTFTVGDAGVHTFNVALHQAGTKSITATDIVTASITGTQAGITVNPGPAATFTVAGFTSPIVAGTSDSFDVTAKDADNNVATGYAGTVHFTSSDGAATLPVNSLLTAGQGTFPGTILRTAGTQSITATDTVTASITGAQTGIVVTSAAATHLSVTGYSSPTTAGVAHNATVTALDQFNNTATGYGGTVHITSSDGAATLPANNTLVSGVRAFSVTLNTLGTQSITATDTVTASITGTQGGITVTAVPNNPPVAVNDSVNVVTGSGYVALDLLTNDSDPDGDSLLITAASNPPHGSVLITGSGTGLSYRPDTGFTGTDTFTYTISDGSLTDTATVTVQVGADTIRPVTTGPVVTLPSQIIGTTTVKLHLAWTGTDQGSGIAHYDLWQSVNGHAYTKILTTTATSTNRTVNVASSYRFKVMAVDKKGNVGLFTYTSRFTVYRYQETSGSIVYGASPWQTLTAPAWSGGHAKSTTTTAFEATFTTVGRSIAWVAARGPSRGTADIYVDGVLKAHALLTSTTTKYRYLIYSFNFATSAAHTMRIVYTGVSGKRVDVDAFVFLR